MRVSHLVIYTLLGWTIQLSACWLAFPELQRRQDTTDTGFPTLTTDSPNVATSSTTVGVSLTSTVSTTPATTSGPSSTLSPAQTTASTEQTSTKKPSSTPTSVLPTASATANTTLVGPNTQNSDALPLEPRITPALGIAGAFLVVLGALYAVIGVKNRLTQIFLSCGFLASIAATVLVDYVMSPPISDAVQGGFFVAIFMTGAVFGGGALIFKEITEGFGCLLGGFCLGMWLLTLKAGGLVTSAGGKGALIGIFCAAAWALSWTSFTRPYALIGSTAFAGATAFVLGIDCFTKAGMKEFWFYLWNLNDNLFPLNTNTYPLTKGIKVEIAVIVVVTIIGVLSQIRLWKVIRSKEQQEEATQQENEQQKDAVEEALGRYLERQNEREKSAWERHYGDRLYSKRNTVLWKDAHQGKRSSTVSVVAVQQSTPSTSSESLEMNAFGPQRNSSAYASKDKRQSSVTIDVIQEVEEDDEIGASVERQKALQALEEHGEPRGEVEGHGNDSEAASKLNAADKHGNGDAPPVVKPETESTATKLKRRSQRSISGLTKRLTPGYVPLGSQSREQLIDTERPISRASSAAATLDEDNEELDVGLLDIDGEDQTPHTTPEIIISSAASDAPEAQEAPSYFVKMSAAHEHISPSARAGHPGSQASSEELNSHALASHAARSIEEAESDDNGRNESKERGDMTSSNSQTSGASNASADSLTKTALAEVPSQLSTVVLSYRTNEWAKHIASADEPIYDEPESYGGDADVSRYAAAAPAPTIVPSSIRASGAGVGITSHPAAGQRAFSDQDRRRPGVKAPSRSVSMQSLKVPGNRVSRASFNPAASTSLVTTPIVENVPTEFTAPKPSTSTRRASGGSPYMLPPSRRSSATRLDASAMRPSSSGSASPYAGSAYEFGQTSKLPSQQFPTSGTATANVIGTSNIRQASYEARQSSQRDLRTDAQKRESLLAEWRLSQLRRTSRGSVDPAMAEAEDRRAQMKAEKDHKRRMEEYQRNEQLKKQAAMDQLMRRPDMQDLHREAMRRMQANAHKQLRSSSG